MRKNNKIENKIIERTDHTQVRFSSLLKSKNGITLIALVITIVVLIILAGVAIMLSLGENGIFTRAQDATQKYRYEAAIEKINLKIAEITTEYITNNNNGDLTLEYLEKELSKDSELEISIEEYNKVAYKSDTLGTITSTLENIIVRVQQYSEYYFMIGKHCTIEKISTDNKKFIEIDSYDGKYQKPIIKENPYTNEDDNTQLLFHFDDNSNDSIGHTTQITGNITYSNDAIWGKSAYFDGSSYIQIEIDEECQLGENFTIDWWEKRENAGTLFYSNYMPGGGGGGLLLSYCGRYLFCSNSYSGWNMITYGEICSDEINEWTHYALVREGSTWYSYRNGKKYWTTNSTGTIAFSLSQKYNIGKYIDKEPNIYQGYIDELRVSPGIARWTSDFDINELKNN